MMALRRFLSVPVLALAVLAGPGCAKKVAVDQLNRLPVHEPEGTRGTLDNTPSDLVLWADHPNTVTDIRVTSAGPDTTYYLAYRTGPGTMQGVIVDYVQSDGYTVFRGQGMRDSAGVAVGGGFRPLDDFVMQPFRRWADRDYYALPAGTVALAPAQLFAFSDRTPPADSLKVYLGRSVVSNASSRSSSLTNRGQGLITGGLQDLIYTGEASPPDSLFRISWQPVTGAAGYWVHIYEPFLRRKELNASGDDAIAMGLPSPIAMGGDRVTVRDWFIAYFPAPLTSHKLGDPLQPGSRVIVYRVLDALRSVLVRVTAIDARGRMIATIGENVGLDGPLTGSRAYNEDDAARARAFPPRAFSVTPQRPPPR